MPSVYEKKSKKKRPSYGNKKKYSHYNYSMNSKPDAISKQEQPQQNLLVEAQKKQKLGKSSSSCQRSSTPTRIRLSLNLSSVSTSNSITSTNALSITTISTIPTHISVSSLTDSHSSLNSKKNFLGV